ncbi:MAG: MFS transporter [Chloroflexi bacterium]|nr:MFS transporter [Chloroflexota bacterium]
MAFQTLAQRLPLLAHNRPFRWLWVSTLFTTFEDILAFTALTLYVLGLSGSGAALASMFALQTLMALLAGMVSDRFNRKRVWIAASGVIALAYSLYPLAESLEQLYILVAVVGVAFTFARNAGLSLLPDLVEEKSLVDANALLSVNFNAALIVAPLVGGGLVAAFGAHAAFYLLAGLRVTAILCVSRIAYRRAGPAVTLARHWLDDLREGLQYARAHAEVRPLLLTALGTNLGVGALQVLEPLLVTQVLGQGAGGYGLLLSVAGLGAMSGSLLIPRVTARWPIFHVFAMSVLLTGLSFFPYAHLLWFPVTLIIVIPQTATWVMGNVLSDTIVQRSVQGAVRGRIFGLFMLIHNAMTLLAMGLLALLVDRVGVALLMDAAGLIYAGAGVYALLVMRRFAAQAAVSTA